jgi:hypothetical protein
VENGVLGEAAEVDIDKFHAKIGQLEMEIDFLKKRTLKQVIRYLTG